LHGLAVPLHRAALAQQLDRICKHRGMERGRWARARARRARRDRPDRARARASRRDHARAAAHLRRGRVRVRRRLASASMRLSPASAALACLWPGMLACTASAHAAARHSPRPPSPPAAPSQPAPAPAPPSASQAVPGRVQLAVLRERGNPPFMLPGQRMVVRGTVTPYVAAQAVKLSVYREGRKVAVKVVPVQPLGNGSGEVHIIYASASPGLVQVRAAHYATPAQAQFSARSRSIRYVSTGLSSGAQGGSVWLLQAELNFLHYN